ncbi:MAG: type IV secretory system conjugative DNA transfer family protein, partial [Rhodanobacter sp.]
MGVLLLICLFFGLWFSGFLTLWLLDLHTPLHVTTYVEYARALGLPAVRPYATTIRLAGWLGFGLPLTLCVIAAVTITWPRAKAFHGDARFASRSDLARAGLLKSSPDGVIIGRAGGDYLYLNGTRHLIMTAPTRTGKTTSIAIPVLLTYQHSIVCMDLKGELYQHTSGYRAAIGQTIYRFAPYAEDGRTHRFNPLMAMSSDPRLRIGELQTLGAILYPDEPGKDPFWPAQARTAFVAFASWLFEAWDDLVGKGFHGPDGKPVAPNTHPALPSFERIYRFSAGDGGELKAFLQERLKQAFVSSATRAAFTSLT